MTEAMSREDMVCAVLETATQDVGSLYEDLCRTFSGFDSKVQGCVSINGVLIAALLAITKLDPSDVPARHHELIFLATFSPCMVIAFVAIIFSGFAMNVRRFPSPYSSPALIQEVRALMQADPDRIDAATRVNFLNGRFNHWVMVTQRLRGAIQAKTKWVRCAQWTTIGAVGVLAPCVLLYAILIHYGKV